MTIILGCEMEVPPFKETPKWFGSMGYFTSTPEDQRLEPENDGFLIGISESPLPGVHFQVPW